MSLCEDSPGAAVSNPVLIASPFASLKPPDHTARRSSSNGVPPHNSLSIKDVCNPSCQ